MILRFSTERAEFRFGGYEPIFSFTQLTNQLFNKFTNQLVTMILRILFFLSFLHAATAASAQSKVENLDIKIMSPQLEKDIPYNYRAKVERKVIDIFTQNGVVNEKGSTFAIYPSLSIVEFGKMEGIKTLQTAQLELSFLVKNIFSNEDFIVFSKSLSGAGNTQKAAINKAIMSIRPQQSIYKNFIEGMSERINGYYEEECNNIIADAQKAINNQEYQKAVSLLNVLPNNSTCKTSNENLLDQAYQKYQTKNCNGLIQKANIAAMKKDYKTAIDYLALVDAQSQCASEAQQALQKIGTASDKQTAKKLEFLNKVYSDNKEIQKARQQSMNAISNTYIDGGIKNN